MRVYTFLSALAPRRLTVKVWLIVAAVQIASCLTQWRLDAIGAGDLYGSIAALIATLAAALLIAFLLAPVREVNRVLLRFARDRSVEGLPVHYSDELGQLMANTTRALISAGREVDAALVAAETDTLTGLMNRRGFDRMVPPSLLGSLLFVDIDHFKRINDEWGHAAGDSALVAAADAISASLRTKDVVARIGGEEFAVFVDETVEARALEVAERVRIRVSETVSVLRRPITVSIGVAVSDVAQPRDVMLEVADAAVYRAKARGRNCVVLGDVRHAA